MFIVTDLVSLTYYSVSGNKENASQLTDIQS